MKPNTHNVLIKQHRHICNCNQL